MTSQYKPAMPAIFLNSSEVEWRSRLHPFTFALTLPTHPGRDYSSRAGLETTARPRSLGGW
jgi:hypothetical protein